MQENIDQNSFEDFQRRFAALAEEAKGYGVFVCVILQTENPIDGTSRLSEKWTGGRMRSIGMLQQGLWHLQEKG